MPIINRDHSKSEQRRVMSFTEISAIGTGTTTIVQILPFFAALEGAYLAFGGLSGSPVVSFNAYRFTSTGFTSIGLGMTVTPTVVGTSGVMGISLIPAPGITLLQNDAIVMALTGTNAAVGGTLFNFVVRGLADINSYAGLA